MKKTVALMLMLVLALTMYLGNAAADDTMLSDKVFLTDDVFQRLGTQAECEWFFHVQIYCITGNKEETLQHACDKMKGGGTHENKRLTKACIIDPQKDRNNGL